MSSTMNIKSKLHQGFVVDALKDLDWKKGSKAPLVVEFDTTEVCNLACPGCISEDLICHKTSFTNQRLLEIAKEMCDAGVKAVILIGGGEPLAHPAVGDFIRYFGEHDVRVGITTNGCFIDKYIDEISEFATWTRTSMDAANQETFDKLRPAKNGKSEFQHIVENMRKLGKRKKGTMGFSFLIRTKADGFGLESNIDNIYDAALLARELGCDYFEVKPSYSYAGGQDHALVVHDKKDMEYARKEIERLNELETVKFHIIKAINLEDSLNQVNRKQDKNYTRCPMAELRTLVCPSGVYICPYWRGKDPYRLGELHSTSFKDMWDSQRRREVVEYTNPIEKCQFHCLRDESNKEAIKIMGMDRNEIDIVSEYDRFI